MDAFLLTVLYLLASVAMALAAIACGFAALPRFEPARLSDALGGLLLRYGLGLSLISWLVIWLGLFGGIRPLPVIVCAGLAIGWGATAARAGLWRLRPLLSAASGTVLALGRSQAPFERVTTALVSLWVAALSVNVILGGLAPDLSHDPMWYHLAVPGQWAITGRAAAFAGVFPSNYPLAFEALYAALLLSGDDVLCSVLAAQVTLAVLMAMIVMTWRWLGWRGAVIAAAVAVPGVAALTALAPVGVKNDRFASLTLLLGCGVLFDRLRPDGGATHKREWVVAGALLGTATAAKTLSAGFWLPVSAVWFAAMLGRGGGVRALMKDVSLVAAGALAAYLPWALRAFQYSGDPFFPYGAAIFPVRESYAAAYEAVRSLNVLAAPFAPGLGGAFGAGLREKLDLVWNSGDFMLGLGIVSGIVALTAREYFWRIQGATLLSLYVFFVMVQGKNEIVRYMAVGYPLMAPAVAGLILRVSLRQATGRRDLLVAGLRVAAVWTYSSQQKRYAAFDTIQWKWQPVVSSAQRAAFAAHAEKGEFYLGFERVRPRIEADATVLLPDSCYPFHLRRRAVWSDESVGRTQPVVPLRWSAAQIMEFLTRNGIRYIVLTRPGADSRYGAMQAQGWIEPIPIPNAVDGHWALFRVRKTPEPPAGQP